MTQEEIPEEVRSIWPIIKHFIMIAALEQAQEENIDPLSVGHSTNAALALIRKVDSYLNANHSTKATRSRVAPLGLNTKPQP